MSRCWKGRYPFRCECYDPGSNGTDGLTFSEREGLCIFKKGFGDPCESEEECVDGLGRGARCEDFVCRRGHGGGGGGVREAGWWWGYLVGGIFCVKVE